MNIILIKRGWGDGAVSIQLASRTHLSALQNDQPFPSNLEYVFRWGCTSTIPNRDNVKVVNRAKAIHWCNDKRQARLDMQEAGVSVPLTFGSVRELVESGIDVNFDWVLRPQTHTQGKNLLVSNGVKDYTYEFERTHGSIYISKFINKVAEYRVNIVQGRVAQLGEKSLESAEQTNWMNPGDRFDNVRWSQWPEAVVKEALKAANVSGIDSCGVDVMVDGEGKAYVLEVNSAPWLGSYGAKCFAKCFDYIVANGKDHFPTPDTYDWKSVIHPAVIQEG